MLYRFKTEGLDNGAPLMEMLVEHDAGGTIRPLFVAVVDHQRRPSNESKVAGLPPSRLIDIIEATSWQMVAAAHDIPLEIVNRVQSECQSRGVTFAGSWTTGSTNQLPI